MLTQGVELLSREDPAANAGPAGRSTSSPVLAQLDEIWEKDLSKVNLPEYVKANATTITFPEKVCYVQRARIYAEGQEHGLTHLIAPTSFHDAVDAHAHPRRASVCSFRKEAWKGTH